MSFFNTYNNLSVRAWQQPTSGIFGQSSNVLANSSAGSNDCSYDGTYYISCGDGSGTNQLRIYIKNANNTLTQQYVRSQLGQTIKINGSYGNVVVQGDYLSDANTFTNNGRLDFYSRSGTTWTVQQTIYGNVTQLRLGTSVAINGDGNRVLTVTRDTGNVGSANVRIYDESGGTWSYVSDTKLNSSNDVGTYIDCSSDANYYVVGHSAVSIVSINDNGTWSNFVGNLGLGISVFINTHGNIVIAGAPDIGNVNTGKVFIYTKTSNIWSETANISAPTVTGNIYSFGVAVSMNNDASTITISGSPDNNSKNNMYIFTGSPSSGYNLNQIITAPNLATFAQNTIMSTSGEFLFTNGGTPNAYQYLYVN